MPANENSVALQIVAESEEVRAYLVMPSVGKKLMGSISGALVAVDDEALKGFSELMHKSVEKLLNRYCESQGLEKVTVGDEDGKN